MADMRRCHECSDLHAIGDACPTCGHDSSMRDKMKCALQRCMMLHHRGLPLEWTRRCTSCDRAIFMLETTCPSCETPHTPIRDELKMLLIRLRKAMQATPDRAHTPVPTAVVAWLRAANAAEKRTAKATRDENTAKYRHFKALVGAIEARNLPMLKELLAEPITPLEQDAVYQLYTRCGTRRVST
ncbi:hypothetical protein SPRG_13104 [Saprolegnia parasitica CBS 223.65]|uniref:Uncharacterized protein n=1 Tax=Saprolegnia parasitica (strain CBS 223.65) TaxID=695850 RepID=A0A067C527_SAPPC|nr:hypothetical protein SPRG_13104 [Saprolegnia parasitica CBS 223.65]KDO21922.1 hypothetical protein SPRG_13104 [Saprolegnia parasitica CBS 223.65]|eukprot:XP_012207364.1 hypothetical protein SPRG_13104 [Saprolegnia parasitica CBS 223.65]